MKISIIGGGPAGLYFAILAKKHWPEWDIAVHERNPAGSTFGFGVVFSDETLGIFRDYDLPSYEAIRRSFAYWGDVDVIYLGETRRFGGNGFCGCARVTLLNLLEERAAELGVSIIHEVEIAGPEQFSGSDLIIAADGINSRIRDASREHFGTRIVERCNKFIWMGSTTPLDAFKYFFRKTEHGVICAHAYQYAEGRSTWVIEMSEACWRGLNLDTLDEAAANARLEHIFAEELGGHPLKADRLLWRNFPDITNTTWVKDNIAMLGDAKATAYFGIGSGTKLAMEDAIHLFDALKDKPDLVAALRHYDTDRREEVEKTQHAANVSASWFEHMDTHWGMEPDQFALSLMTRSKQITWENLRLRDPGAVERAERWFSRHVAEQGYGADANHPAPPAFHPFRLRGMELGNRFVVSPMAQYSATDGLPDDWHFVHYTSRALGGAALVFTEMTCPSLVSRITPGCACLFNNEQMKAWKRICDFIHKRTPARFCLQIGHAGRKGSTQLGWDEMDHPLKDGNWPMISASPLPYLPGISQTPKEMDRGDMDQVIGEWVNTVKLADKAGFDMIEAHFAHGYLLASFISPLTNRRGDDYGGPIENRMRFPLELFSAMRAAWPEDKPMSVRLSSSDWREDGISQGDLATAARLLKEAGADLIDCSAGQTVPDQEPVYGRMFQTPFADFVRHEVGIATMAVGNITTADQANTIVASGRADLVAFARPHLTNPYFTLSAAAEYDHREQWWPRQYDAGKFQAHVLAERARAELIEMKTALRPPSHEVSDEA